MTAKAKKTLKIVIIVLVSLVLLFSVASVIVCGIIYDGQFDDTSVPNWETKYGANYEWAAAKGYTWDTVKVPSDDVELTGRVFGTENTKGLVVFCHGLGGGTELYIAEICGLVDRGWQVLGVDFRGHMTSPDVSRGIPQSQIDLDNILTWVEGQDRFEGMDVVLFGHSWGGYAVTSVLNYDHDVKAVVAVSGLSDAYGFISRQMVDMLGAFGKIEGIYGSIYQFLKFGRAAGRTSVKGINNVEIPVMIVQGSHDTTVTGVDQIYAHQDEITNPYVIYDLRTGAGTGTHNYVLRSEAAYEYINEVDAELEALEAAHGGSLTYEEEVAFYATVDDDRISEIDMAFWDNVSAFYDSCIR